MACVKRGKIVTISIALTTEAHKSPRLILSEVDDKNSDLILDVNLNNIM